MTTMSMKAVAAFSFLALAAAPALAYEDHADTAAMPLVHGATSESMGARPMDGAAQTQTPRSEPNAEAYREVFPDIGFGKWWVGD